MEFVFRPDDAGRIGIYQLEVIAVQDAEDPVACGLGLGSDDRQPFPDQPVHERRLAHIGFPDDIHKPCLMF